MWRGPLAYGQATADRTLVMPTTLVRLAIRLPPEVAGRDGARSAPAGDERGHLGLEVAERALRVGAVLVRPGEQHDALGHLGEVPLQGEQLHGVRRETLGPATGLDVGVPRVVAVGTAEHVAEVPL